MKRLLLLLVAFLWISALTQAATITVSKNAGDNANASTINGAVDLANSGDTIQILDSALYSEDFRLPVNKKGNGTVLDSLSISVAANQTPTLERPASAATGPVIRFGPGSATTTVTGPFDISGASPTARMTIRQLRDNTPPLNSGQNFLGTHAITAENLILERPTDSSAANTGPFIKYNSAGNNTVTNILLKGRAVDDTDDMIHIAMAAGSTFTANNVDFSQASGKDTGGLFVNPKYNTMIGLQTSAGNSTTCDLVFNNCNIALSQASKDAGYSMAIYRDRLGTNGHVTFNDCTFNSGGKAGALGQRGFEFGSDVVMTLNRPIFASGLGDLAFHLTATNEGSPDVVPTLNINGAPGSKVNFDPLIQGGTVMPIRALQGKVNLTDCTRTVGSAGAAILETTWEGGAVGPIDVTMNRCLWGDNCGPVVFIFLDGSANGVASPFPCSFSATNTIWAGATGRGAIIDRSAWNMGTAVLPLTVTLNHCTLTGKTGNILVGLDPAANDPEPVANYCIFDSSQTVSKAANGTHKLTGKGNLSWSGGAGAPSQLTWWSGEPADTLHLNPKLDATGHIAIDSFAGGAAIGSTETIDVDGQLRPLGGTTPDIGADETYAVPVELSGFSAE